MLTGKNNYFIYLLFKEKGYINVLEDQIKLFCEDVQLKINIIIITFINDELSRNEQQNKSNVKIMIDNNKDILK